MSLWAWIKGYWKGLTFLIATPDKHYRVVFLKGNIRITTEITEFRGDHLRLVWIDEQSGK